MQPTLRLMKEEGVPREVLGYHVYLPHERRASVSPFVNGREGRLGLLSAQGFSRPRSLVVGLSFFKST